MTLRHMRIFIVVYQEMNITKASNKLHMTQPAVTRAIKEIETHYDIQLLCQGRRAPVDSGSAGSAGLHGGCRTGYHRLPQEGRRGRVSPQTSVHPRGHGRGGVPFETKIRDVTAL